MRFPRLCPPLRLWTRIAAMMFLAVLAVEALNAVVFVFIPTRLMTAYSAHWLIEMADEAALAIFKADAKARDALSARLGAENHIHIRWQPVWDEADRKLPEFTRPFLERVRTAIEGDLQGNARRATVRGLFGPRGNPFRVDVQFYPPDFVKRMPLRPLRPEEDDLAIPGPFELGVQGLDGSWIILEPEGTPSYAGRLKPWFITLLGAAMLVSLLSVFTARKSLRPLDRLTAAARSFGRTRQAVSIDPAGLREFGVIARAMNEMQQRIKVFLDERTHMLAAMSHDLRTGLTGLRLDAEELEESEARERVIAGVEEMERMISATLAFAGDDLKGEPTEMIDLAALLISLCDSFSDRNYAASYSGPNHLTIPAKPPTDSGINPPADSGDNSPTHSGVISPGGTGACWRWDLTVVLGGGQSSSVRL